MPEWGLYTNYFFADETGTDAMTKALYEREMTIEEYLGVTIAPVWTDHINNVPVKVREANMSGDDLYQLVLTHCIMGVSSMITDELLLDMNTISAINFDADYYNKTAIENLTVNGRNYYSVSDYMIPDPNAILFNKNLIEEFNLEDPYELVRNGEWTIDKMLTMMAVATKDNGDGKWDINDNYGFGTPNDWFLAGFMFSSGLELANKNSEGEYELKLGKDELSYTVFDKLAELLIGADTYVYPYDDENLDNCLTIDKGRTLFGLTALNQLHTLRDADVEFGILPQTKLDETQENYRTLDWSVLMCVPSTVKNADMVGEVIELLAYYSDEAVLPAYYDITLGEKLARDPESKEMMGIIFDSVVYDAGMNYFGFTGNNRKLLFTVGRVVDTPGFSLSSHLASYGTGAEAEIEAFNAAIAALDEAE